MTRFFVLTLNGLTQGAIYASMALALVLIWRATKIINFAQGAMAMFTTYLALFAIEHGAPYWLGFIVALTTGLLIGAVVERVIVRPVGASAQRRHPDAWAAALPRSPRPDVVRGPDQVVPSGLLDRRAAFRGV